MQLLADFSRLTKNRLRWKILSKNAGNASMRAMLLGSAGDGARRNPKRSRSYGDTRQGHGPAEKQGQSGSKPHTVLRDGGLQLTTVWKTIGFAARITGNPWIAEREFEKFRQR